MKNDFNSLFKMSGFINSRINFQNMSWSSKSAIHSLDGEATALVGACQVQNLRSSLDWPDQDLQFNKILSRSLWTNIC